MKTREMTLREWANLPDDVSGELVDGLLVEEEMATLPHEAVVYFLLMLFKPVHDRGGLVIPSEFKYGVAPRRGRKADLSVYLPGSSTPDHRLGTTPPDIAIEVVTARPKDARRDRVEKTVDYARFGIKWYWIVDPALRIVEVLELGARRRYSLAVSASSGKLTVPGCRGLKLDIDKLWASVDRLSK